MAVKRESWSSVIPLNHHSVESFVPEAPGLYLLFEQVEIRNWVCLRSGQATNLKRTLRRDLSLLNRRPFPWNKKPDGKYGIKFVVIRRSIAKKFAARKLTEIFQPLDQTHQKV